jgi:hypothetical protein
MMAAPGDASSHRKHHRMPASLPLEASLTAVLTYSGTGEDDQLQAQDEFHGQPWLMSDREICHEEEERDVRPGI